MDIIVFNVLKDCPTNFYSRPAEARLFVKISTTFEVS